MNIEYALGGNSYFALGEYSSYSITYLFVLHCHILEINCDILVRVSVGSFYRLFKFCEIVNILTVPLVESVNTTDTRNTINDKISITFC